MLRRAAALVNDCNNQYHHMRYWYYSCRCALCTCALCAMCGCFRLSPLPPQPHMAQRAGTHGEAREGSLWVRSSIPHACLALGGGHHQECRIERF